ncbi:hypothetical protein FLL45_15150 [Aliikangiella marina]|uniref:Uncharacterized protein n=1 Tax=Aliikangiella marina TaxID=1712262 RepID=A0A545T6F5_9GAMM|nr:hypothetical protein [Aliikangiella marina]TQV72804.1 hypothetical protein FLL45_15150 [Aliikangiella marina]
MRKNSAFIKVVWLVATVSALGACSTVTQQQKPRVNSPFGVFKYDGEKRFWVAIERAGIYYLCDENQCEQNKVERVAVNYGVILIDFFTSSMGLAIEKLSHGENVSEAYIAKMRKIRLQNSRPNDLAFNIGYCGETPCVGIGHRGSGVKFRLIQHDMPINNSELKSLLRTKQKID